jgi:alpha-tubulin suppressor-like RCC1 family protein
VSQKVLACWGNGDFGRLGHGLPCTSELIPRVVSALAGQYVVRVACGGAHTAAVTGTVNTEASNLSIPSLL